MIKLSYSKEALVVIAATRYYLGRMSASVGSYCDWLASAWPDIEEGTRVIMQRDIEDEFRRDDSDRAEGREHKALGHDCDRKSWETVRAAWLGLEASE